jgi:hypothetical protein
VTYEELANKLNGILHQPRKHSFEVYMAALWLQERMGRDIRRAIWADNILAEAKSAVEEAGK